MELCPSLCDLYKCIEECVAIGSLFLIVVVLLFSTLVYGTYALSKRLV